MLSFYLLAELALTAAWAFLIAANQGYCLVSGRRPLITRWLVGEHSSRPGSLSSCGSRAWYCGSWAVEHKLSRSKAQGLAAPRHAGSSIRIKRGPCIGKQTLTTEPPGGPMGWFMCQLHWATGYPDIGSNIILDILLKVF